MSADRIAEFVDAVLEARRMYAEGTESQWFLSVLRVRAAYQSLSYRELRQAEKAVSRCLQ